LTSSTPFCAQRKAETCVFLLDRKHFFKSNRTRIDSRFHSVHRDSVARFTPVDRPAWRVQPGAARKRAGMEVVGSEARDLEHRRRHDVERVHIENELHTARR
jgi:hypothetical protein